MHRSDILPPQQSNEWNASLCIGLIEFKTDFVRIHHSTLENPEALWTTTEDGRPHQHSISEL